ncbi:hypothetical protein ACH5RR_007871 [Cinchona calisaya]|uniref:SAC domain-containing protein n=1 Tax=Cinchona calisaya TaxID=153742 RepID=A0ABD3AA42_9GENT
MGSENYYHRRHEMPRMDFQQNSSETPIYMHKFKLYETLSNFYMIGWDKSKTFWKVLKIDRSEPTELNIVEDSVMYTEMECYDLLQRIDDGNRSTGGLKFVTMCYGIVGFVKLLGPYYLLLITKRRKIGIICGHAVYSITKSEMIPIPNSTVQSNMALSKNENRYKKLLRTVDLTKDFFFSYSYNIMLSLQKNLGNCETGIGLYETLFVWNEYLTRGIRNQLKNAMWTVALVHGFFRQVKLSVSGRNFLLTLIARRSRHYAGTRYLKRGVNEKGRVANDVETEQIVLEDSCEACSLQISSVVQIRGSIPLFWSQETSRLNIKPDIILSRKDNNYAATKLHFENLVKRYGNPIIILNLVKTREKKPRESILRAEFANAIEFINKDLSDKNHLKFLHWDINKHSRKATSALARLVDVAAYALDLTGFFYCQGITPSRNDDLLNWSYFDSDKWDYAETKVCTTKSTAEVHENSCSIEGDNIKKPLMFQNGVLRTNCIDCLDRTNVAQYAYGLVALGRQLHALGFMDATTIDMDSPLADSLMKVYEEMGDTLALQYGGSPAHKKIFAARRGQWKAATQSQELLRTLQRYYSNAYMDGEKQDSINVFLGHFQPQLGKPALWELDSDQHYNVGRHGSDFAGENSRLLIKRSFSDGNILCESNSPIEDANVEQNQDSNILIDKAQNGNKGLSESTPEISTCGSNISYSRCTPSMSCRKLFAVGTPDPESDGIYFHDQGDSLDCSNFLDFDWLSSSGNSIEEEMYERSTLISTPSADLACYCDANNFKGESSSAYASSSSIKGKEHCAGDANVGTGDLSEFSETFINWVIHGNMLFP